MAYQQLLASARTRYSCRAHPVYATTVVPAERRLARTFVIESAAIERSSERAQNDADHRHDRRPRGPRRLVLLLSFRVNRFRGHSSGRPQRESGCCVAPSGSIERLSSGCRGSPTSVRLTAAARTSSALSSSRILGYRPEEWHDDPELFHQAHPSRRSCARPRGRPDLPAREGSQVFEYRMVARDGRRHLGTGRCRHRLRRRQAGRARTGLPGDVTLLKLATTSMTRCSRRSALQTSGCASSTR